MEVILKVNDLFKKFGEKAVVDNISFEVKKGQIMGLLGPNGAGKTTAIRMIMGILSPDAGEIIFNGGGKNSFGNHILKNRIGYLPEERGLYDEARVLENLTYLADLKGVSLAEGRKKALHWLERFEIEDYANQKLEKLSKGMQQKVQFIATVLHQPDLVLLDEPFSGLDPVNQDVFKELIKELKDKGATVLLSAHQMNLVEELCQSIFMINRGKRVLYGPIDKIKEEHGVYSVEIYYQRQEDITFLESKQGVSDLKVDSGRAFFRYRGGQSLNEMLQCITSRLTVKEIYMKKPPLHDIFVQTVLERGDSFEEEVV